MAPKMGEVTKEQLEAEKLCSRSSLTFLEALRLIRNRTKSNT